MCRHVAYVGPPRSVSSVVLDGPHSLSHQAYAARELMTGVVAADGFGAAWYPPGGADDSASTSSPPVLYRSPLPIWADASFASVAAHSPARLVVANVRNATEAGTTATANVHPFQDGHVVLSHNGYLEDFWRSWMRRLRGRLTDGCYAALRGATESETMLLLVRSVMEEGTDLVEAVRRVVVDLRDEARERDLDAELNLLVADGARVVGTRAGAKTDGNSLYVAHHEDSTWIASEPLDDVLPWAAVPSDSLVVARDAEPVQMGPL